jgi:hypothetical protein
LSFNANFYISQKILSQSKQMLLEGYLNEEFVLTHVTNVIALLRECNIALRWYMLHSAALPQSEINILVLELLLSFFMQLPRATRDVKMPTS